MMYDLNERPFRISTPGQTIFQKGDVLWAGRGRVLVIKVYKNNWFRQLLTNLGIKNRAFHLKVKSLRYDS
jgi:hypothetical protein